MNGEFRLQDPKITETLTKQGQPNKTKTGLIIEIGFEFNLIGARLSVHLLNSGETNAQKDKWRDFHGATQGQEVVCNDRKN